MSWFRLFDISSKFIIFWQYIFLNGIKTPHIRGIGDSIISVKFSGKQPIIGNYHLNGYSTLMKNTLNYIFLLNFYIKLFTKNYLPFSIKI